MLYRHVTTTNLKSFELCRWYRGGGRTHSIATIGNPETQVQAAMRARRCGFVAHRSGTTMMLGKELVSLRGIGTRSLGLVVVYRNSLYAPGQSELGIHKYG